MTAELWQDFETGPHFRVSGEVVSNIAILTVKKEDADFPSRYDPRPDRVKNAPRIAEPAVYIVTAKIAIPPFTISNAPENPKTDGAATAAKKIWSYAVTGESQTPGVPNRVTETTFAGYCAAPSYNEAIGIAFNKTIGTRDGFKISNIQAIEVPKDYISTTLCLHPLIEPQKNEH